MISKYLDPWGNYHSGFCGFGSSAAELMGFVFMAIVLVFAKLDVGLYR